MAVTDKQAVSILNHLVEIDKDAEEGFRTASQHVADERLQSVFRDFSAQRAEFAADLQQAVSRLGGKPEQSGTLAGAMHRGWVTIKGRLSGKSDRAILIECERGEDAAVKAYQDALAEELPSGVRCLVQQQYHKVQTAHDDVRCLRDRANPGPAAGYGTARG